MPARIVVLASLLLLAHRAWAQPSADSEARRYFRQGNASSAQGHYADALASYREAYRLQPRPSVLFNIARCEELLGDYEASYADFERLLALEKSSGELRAEAQAKLSELAGRLTVAVQVTSLPAGAELSVDGAQAGSTPAIVRVRVGRHTLRLTAPGVLPKEIALDARPGATPPIDVVLARLAHVEVSAEPADAHIRPLDVAGESTSGRWTADVPEGTHRFAIERPGYAAAEIEIRARAGENVLERVALHKRDGVLVVRANVPGAAVSLDGIPAGLVPSAEGGLRLEVGEGPHELIVERPGLRSFRGRVVATAERTATVDVRLAPARSSRARIATWTLGGAGVASLLAGSVFGVLAIDDRIEYDRTHSAEVADRLDSRALTADVLLGVGAASLLAAALVHHYATREDSRATIAQP